VGTAPWCEGGCSVCRELEVRTPRLQRRLFDLRSDFTSKLPSQVSCHRKLILCIPWILVTPRPVSPSPRQLSTSVAWCYLNSSHMPFICGGVGGYSQRPNVIPIARRTEYFTSLFRRKSTQLSRQHAWTPIPACATARPAACSSRRLPAIVLGRVPVGRDCSRHTHCAHDPPRRASRFLMRGPHRQKAVVSRSRAFSRATIVNRASECGSTHDRSWLKHLFTGNIEDLLRYAGLARATATAPSIASLCGRCFMLGLTRIRRAVLQGVGSYGRLWQARKFSPRRPAHRAKVAQRPK
jgi:hypothetical protein